MLIVIEGPDGSGKTTLINKLNKLGIISMPPIPRQHHLQYEMFKMYAINSADGIYCMDRCYITEWIYRCVKNDNIANITLDNIVKCLNIKNVRYIFCKNKNSYKNALSRGEDYVVKKDEHDLLTKYYEFVQKTLENFTNVDVVSYNYENDNFDNIIDWIKGNNYD